MVDVRSDEAVAVEAAVVTVERLPAMSCIEVAGLSKEEL